MPVLHDLEQHAQEVLLRKRTKEKANYAGCSVSDDWLTFDNFKSWMEKQDWEGKWLDKDLLEKGNKTYCHDKCAFVSREVNMFLVDRAASRGEFLIGCYWQKAAKKFHAKCSNPFTGKQEYLGLFSKEEDAHLAWVKRKREIAHALSEKARR